MLIVNDSDLPVNIRDFDYVYITKSLKKGMAYLNGITNKQTVIIGGRVREPVKDTLIKQLNLRHVNYSVSGSNKALLYASNN